MTASSATPVRTTAELVRERYIRLATANYAAGDTAAKRAIRNAMKSRMDALMLVSDPIAFTWNAAINGLVSAKAKPVIVVDHDAVLADRIVTLRRAAEMLITGMVTPEGFDDGDLDLGRVAELVAAEWALPEVTEANALAASKLAASKITRSTDRNSIDDVVARAIDGQAAGTFLTVADVRRMGSVEGYSPSDGAIAARLFPKSGACTLAGVTAVSATVDAPRGLSVN